MPRRRQFRPNAFCPILPSLSRKLSGSCDPPPPAPHAPRTRITKGCGSGWTLCKRRHKHTVRRDILIPSPDTPDAYNNTSCKHRETFLRHERPHPQAESDSRSIAGTNVLLIPRPINRYIQDNIVDGRLFCSPSSTAGAHLAHMFVSSLKLCEQENLTKTSVEVSSGYISWSQTWFFDLSILVYERPVLSHLVSSLVLFFRHTKTPPPKGRAAPSLTGASWSAFTPRMRGGSSSCTNPSPRWKTTETAPMPKSVTKAELATREAEDNLSGREVWEGRARAMLYPSLEGVGGNCIGRVNA